jgi:multidrug resistance efflux pump
MNQPSSTSCRPASGQLGERVRGLRLSHLPERRTNWGKIAAWIAFLAVVSLGAWLGYKQFASSPGDEEQASAPPTEAEDKPPAEASGPGASQSSSPTRSTKAAEPAPGEVVLEAKGYIVPRQQILVSPKVSGMILELDIEEGRRVNKGDVLAVLESTEYQSDFERSKATVKLMRVRLSELENGSRPQEIKQAEAQLREAEAQVTQLQADFERNRELRKNNSVTQQELELSQSKFVAMKEQAAALSFALQLMQIGPREEQIEAARAELDQAEADLVKAEWRLGNCTIRAPISGTILKKNAEEGNIVNPIAFNGSYSVCEMADLSDLEVDLNIQERDIAVIRVGQKCRVRAEAYPDRIYEGHVARLMPIADRAKGAIPVRVKVRVPTEEEGVYLKPEMGAIVTFLNEQAPSPTTLTTARPVSPSSQTDDAPTSTNMP